MDRRGLLQSLHVFNKQGKLLNFRIVSECYIR